MENRTLVGMVLLALTAFVEWTRSFLFSVGIACAHHRGSQTASLRAFALVVVLAPSFLQTDVASCEAGDTTLSLLDFEVSGQHLIAFSSDQRSYDVQTDADTAIVRAQSTDPAAEVSYDFRTPDTFLGGESIGVGGGEVTLALPVGQTILSVSVQAPDGASDSYVVNVERSEPPPLPEPGPGLQALRVSSSNPRYFEDASGNIVYLAGSHTWLNLHDAGMTDPPPEFDYTTWLDFLEQHGHNFFRLWAWEQSTWIVNTSDRVNFGPSRYLRSGPGTALDGKPKFDLTKLDQQYFDRVRERVIEAGQRGMWVSVMLFNGFSVDLKGRQNEESPWRGHPYNGANNINGINGDLNGDESGVETHELRNVLVTELQEAFIRKVIDTVNDLDNVLYEISNESHSGSLQWQSHMIDVIKSYEAGKPKQHPVGLTVPFPNGQNSDLLGSDADWVSLNGGLNDPPIADGTKVIISDTDHLCGTCGDRQWAWRSFTRGENPLFMDPYSDAYGITGHDPNSPQFVSLRDNLGYIRSYADRMDLEKTVPRGGLSSTGYCLANTAGPESEYLIYSPKGGSITVDLSATPDEFTVEWFNPSNGEVSKATPIIGGSENRIFELPSSIAGDAVLYLRTATVDE